MERAQALTALQALANGTRLDLVRLLIQAGEAGVAAGEIARKLGLSPSRLSFHLAALESAGLVASRRDARHVFYSADPGGLGGTIGFLLADCCLHHPDVTACCRRSLDAAAPAPRITRSPAG
ncbi:MAG: ArsR/SmtB family transcription factor [Gemmobacter sp.]